MAQKLLLVDFENVQQLDLPRLDKSFKVMIFVGAAQKSVPYELVQSSQSLGSRVKWHRVEGSGKNALDFLIACHLGRIAESAPDTRCTVLSKDKGYDPLIRHLNNEGLACCRVNSQLELGGEPHKAYDNQSYKKAMSILMKITKNKRPRKTETLKQYILSSSGIKVSSAEVQRIVDLMFAEKKISELNTSIHYHF